jgi:sodium/proline symporter
MERSSAASLTILIFVAVLFAVSAWARARTHNATDFLLASRRLGPWLLALGYTGSATNAWILLAVSGAAFAWGLSAVWLWLAFVLGDIINWFYIAPRVRALSGAQGTMTLVQVLTADSGDRMQRLVVRSAVGIVFVLLLMQTGAQLHALGDVVAENFGVASSTTVILGALLVFACTVAGGFWFANLCDALQISLLLVMAALMSLAGFMATGGWEDLRLAFTALGPEASNVLGGRHGVVAVAFAAGVLSLGLSISGQPQAMARYMAARDELTIARARWISLLWMAVLLAAMLACGWSAKVLYAGLENAEYALLSSMQRMLPPWASAIAIAIVVGTLLCALVSPLLAVAATLATDLKRAAVPFSLTWSRAALLGAVVLMACFALFADTRLVDHTLFSMTTLGATFGPLLLVRLSGKRVRPGASLGAMWAGAVLSLLFHLLPDSPGDFLERVLPFVAALGIALTGGERRRNPDRADRTQETVHDRVPI